VVFVRAEVRLRVSQGTANSDSLSSAEAGMSSAGEEAWALTSTSNPTTLSSSTSIVRCAAACWVCNEFDTSIADSSWAEREGR
jgi:hypothetical protein